jgi:flagellar secretion chaperone FliS
MSLNNAYEKYRINSVNTATPEELIHMLYNGLVKFILQAISSINDSNIEKANSCIIKAQNIVVELQVSLDKKIELSANLEILYDYIYRRLMDANLQKDIKVLEEILYFAKQFRDTWGQAIKIAKQQNRQASKVVSSI